MVDVVTDRRRHEPEGEPLACGHPTACLIHPGAVCGWGRDVERLQRMVNKAVPIVEEFARGSMGLFRHEANVWLCNAGLPEIPWMYSKKTERPE